jgi:carboxyl-terminal processing protease
MPDVFIPRDTAGQNAYYAQLVFESNIIYEYALTYADQNRALLRSFNTWQDMYHHLDRQHLISHLVDFAREKGIKPQDTLPPETQSLISRYTQAYIVRIFFGDNGYYPILLHNDPVLQKAVSLLQANKALPAAVAKMTYSK